MADKGKNVEVDINPAVRFFGVLEVVIDRLDTMATAREAIEDLNKLPISDKTKTKIETLKLLLATAADGIVEQALEALEEV